MLRGPIFICLALLLFVRAEAALMWSYTNEDTPRRCATDCDNFGKNYAWCWVTRESQAPCTPGDAVLRNKLAVSESGIPCVSLCGKFDGSPTNWCFTSIQPMKAETCQESDIQELFLSRTEEGEFCRTKCYPNLCDVSINNIKSCTPGDLPIEPSKVRGSAGTIRCTSLCGKYTASEENECQASNGWQRCDSNSVHKVYDLLLRDSMLTAVLTGASSTTPRRVRRGPPSLFNKCTGIPYLVNVGIVNYAVNFLRNYFHGLPSFTQNMLNPRQSAVRYASTIVADPDGQSHRIRVHYIEAHIYVHHLRCSQSREQFQRQVSNIRMRELDAIDGDERGHLLAHSLGGSNEMWNLVPQSLAFNRGGDWRRSERDDYRQMVENSNMPGRYIQREVFVRYGNRGNRPTAYTVISSLREADGTRVSHERIYEFNEEDDSGLRAL